MKGGVAMVTRVVVALTPALTAAQPLHAAAERASIRAKPSAESTILTTVERGAELLLLGTPGSWYCVRVRPEGPEGYIHRLLVDRLPVSEEVQPPAPLLESASPTPAARSRLTGLGLTFGANLATLSGPNLGPPPLWGGETEPDDDVYHVKARGFQILVGFSAPLSY